MSQTRSSVGWNSLTINFVEIQVSFFQIAACKTGDVRAHAVAGHCDPIEWHSKFNHPQQQFTDHPANVLRTMRCYRIEICGQRMPIDCAYISVAIFSPIVAGAYHPTCARRTYVEKFRKISASDKHGMIKFGGISTISISIATVVRCPHPGTPKRSTFICVLATHETTTPCRNTKHYLRWTARRRHVVHVWYVYTKWSLPLPWTRKKMLSNLSVQPCTSNAIGFVRTIFCDTALFVSFT